MLTNIGLLIVGAYLLGSIPFALVVSKLKGVNLRKVGSGNLGATNVYRAMGFPYALLVFLLDAFKGFLPVYYSFFISEQPYVHVLVGFAAIVGHSLTIFAGFKGGKGAATGLGVLCALAPDIFLILFVSAITIIFVTKYVSLATILCSLAAPILMLLLGYDEIYVFFIGLICFFIIWRHRENIDRLMKGTENKIGKKKRTSRQSSAKTTSKPKRSTQKRTVSKNTSQKRTNNKNSTQKRTTKPKKKKT